MNDQTIKNIIAYTIRNKDFISYLLGQLNADEIERGYITITEDMVTKALRPIVAARYGNYVKDFSLAFRDGMIFADGNIFVDKFNLGHILARYMFKIGEFNFYEGNHKIYLKYSEDIRSQGNALQSTALKVFLSRGDLISHLPKYFPSGEVAVSGHNIMIDLDQFSFADAIPVGTELVLLNCEDGALRFSFKIL